MNKSEQVCIFKILFYNFNQIKIKIQIQNYLFIHKFNVIHYVETMRNSNVLASYFMYIRKIYI